MRVYAKTGIDHRTLDYDDFFALWLGAEEVTAAENFNAAVATAVGMGKGRLPRTWIEAAVRGERGVAEWRNWDVFRLMGGG